MTEEYSDILSELDIIKNILGMDKKSEDSARKRINKTTGKMEDIRDNLFKMSKISKIVFTKKELLSKKKNKKVSSSYWFVEPSEPISELPYYRTFSKKKNK